MEVAGRGEPLDDDEPRTRRTWPTRRGEDRTEALTELQWGFQAFTFLRNDIAHGEPITPERFSDESGRSMLGLGEWWLRRAFRETVTLAGNKDLRMKPMVRKVMRRLREMEQ